MFQMTELLVDNPACVHCLVTEHILESLERFNGSLPFVVDPEGAVFIIFVSVVVWYFIESWQAYELTIASILLKFLS